MCPKGGAAQLRRRTSCPWIKIRTVTHLRILACKSCIHRFTDKMCPKGGSDVAHLVPEIKFSPITQKLQWKHLQCVDPLVNWGDYNRTISCDCPRQPSGVWSLRQRAWTAREAVQENCQPSQETHMSCEPSQTTILPIRSKVHVWLPYPQRLQRGHQAGQRQWENQVSGLRLSWEYVSAWIAVEQIIELCTTLCYWGADLWPQFSLWWQQLCPW